MGQLERYGLYVLCLVIFLILGVAIWGDGADAKATTNANVAQRYDKPLKSEDEKQDEFEKLLQQQERETFAKQDAAEGLFKPADDDDKSIKKVDDVETPPVRPVAQKIRTHTVRDGDNLESISRRFLGKRHLWREILAINPGVNERNLKLGTVLKIPARKASSAPVRTGRRGRTYIVREGDSAWKIAAKHYGRKKADEYSKRILIQNHIRDAGALKAGMKISLPQ
jgi:nucleoid-associated protein YgaU